VTSAETTDHCAVLQPGYFSQQLTALMFDLSYSSYVVVFKPKIPEITKPKNGREA
jgi:hypothetical protein